MTITKTTAYTHPHTFDVLIIMRFYINIYYAVPAIACL